MSKIENQSVLTSKYQLPDLSEKELETKSTISSTEYMTDSFKKVRTSAKSYGMADEEIIQTLTLTNDSEYDITVTDIKETISEAGSYKPGSVTVDGVEKPDFDLMAGFALENPITKNGGETVITYVLTISDAPSTDIVNAQSAITYSVNERDDLKENSNTVDISIVTEKLVFTKTSDKSAVIKGETLVFMHEIKNEGTTKNTELFFKDELPAGVTFDAGSVKINEVVNADADPATGFSLGDLDVGATVKVEFSVTVN